MDLINNVTQEKISFDDIIEDDFVYSRSQKDNSNKSVLINKLKAGTVLDSITLQKVSDYPAGEGIQEKAIIIIDGGHRLEAVKEFNKLAKDEDNEYSEVTLGFSYFINETIDYESNKSKLLIASHHKNDSSGMPSRNQDTKKTARNLKKANPDWTQEDIGKKLGRDRSTISPYIKDILEKEKITRKKQVMRLSQLGWTQQQIGEVIGKSQGRVAQIINNVDTNKINNSYKIGKSINEIADYENLDIQTIWSIVLEDKSDWDKITELTRAKIRAGRDEANRNEPISQQEIDNARFIKNHKHWYFNSCWKLMGQKYDGQIPGRILLNILFRFTEQGDVVIDPMAGGGVAADACLLMNRKCYSYDIKPSRYDILEYDITEDIPEGCKKADLIFLDPPYFVKKADEYSLPEKFRTRDGFLNFAKTWCDFCDKMLKQDGFIAFLMGSYEDYDDSTQSLYSWDYLPLFNDNGFSLYRSYQVPQNTQNFRPDEEATTNNWNAKKDITGHLLNNDRLLFVLKRS